MKRVSASENWQPAAIESVKIAIDDLFHEFISKDMLHCMRTDKYRAISHMVYLLFLCGYVHLDTKLRQAKGIC